MFGVKRCGECTNVPKRSRIGQLFRVGSPSLEPGRVAESRWPGKTGDRDPRQKERESTHPRTDKWKAKNRLARFLNVRSSGMFSFGHKIGGGEGGGAAGSQ